MLDRPLVIPRTLSRERLDTKPGLSRSSASRVSIRFVVHDIKLIGVLKSRTVFY